jgi:hypothetical protein
MLLESPCVSAIGRLVAFRVHHGDTSIAGERIDDR